jgi:isoquinoline 1-oxidoreductase beta subunit
MIVRITRRDFLRQAGVGAGALMFGFCLSPSIHAGLARNLREGFPVEGVPFVVLKLNGDVVILTHRTEMGQGIRSSLAAVLADEMEADWNRVTLRSADANVRAYAIEVPFLLPGGAKRYLIEGEAAQLTDNSRSMTMYFEVMRLFGAGLRLAMIRAAAKKWGVRAEDCLAEKHKVVGPGGRSSDYRWLLAGLKNENPTYDEIAASLKKPEEWRYIGKGKEPVPFYDVRDIVLGKTVYAADVHLAGMLTAVIERCPVANGALLSYDPAPALAVKGVRLVLPLFPPGRRGGGVGRSYLPHAGVAVVATSTWTALRGRDALRPTIKWDLGPNAAYDSESYRNGLETSAAKPGKIVRSKGNVDEALAQPANTVEASYYVPHLAAVPMEPPAAVALFRNGQMEVWAPTQSPDITQQMAGQIALGLSDAQMTDEAFKEKARQAATVHVTMVGGGFGRKLYPDFVIEAAILARQMRGVPIRVQWTREDDIRFSYYNAPSAQYLKAALDAEGHTTALLQCSSFPSLFGTFFPNSSTPGLSAAEIEASQRTRLAFDGETYPYASSGERGEGLEDMPYDVPNLRLENGPAENHIRIGCVRSAANIFHAFALCSFADELARAAGRDSKKYLFELIGSGHLLPLAAEKVVRPDNNGLPLVPIDVPSERGRSRRVMAGFPPDTRRLRAVVEQVARDAGWDQKQGRLPKGRGLGIAAHRSYLSYVAIVADVSLDADGGLKINEIHGAIDCGLAVNRDRVLAQMEGGIIYGLGIALYGEITVKNGAVVQKDFDDYPVLRMNRTPRISVSIVDSDDPPTGVGEPPTPVVAPALANAIVAAGGPRIRELPLSKRLSIR